MIKDLREKVKMYMQLYVFVDIVKKDSPSLRKQQRGAILNAEFFCGGPLQSALLQPLDVLLAGWK